LNLFETVSTRDMGPLPGTRQNAAELGAGLDVALVE
jgi:hypothetical protein